MSGFEPLQKKDLPVPPSPAKAIGVGVVVLGLAIGTGELILWPHLSVKYGLGILWGAFLGISLQYLINREVARHALATGESFFTSTTRLAPILAWFWLGAALVLYIWPGWAVALGTILKEIFGFGSYPLWAWVSLAIVLLITFSGKRAYATLELALKIIVPLFIALLIWVSFGNLTWALIKEAIWSWFNFGWLPAGVDLNVLFGAIVFAGTGGLLNLCISLWGRDKGLGMGAYSGDIVNPITGSKESVSALGSSFEPNQTNLKRWRGWMRYVTLDQGLIFWALGLITLTLLSLNSYAVLRPRGLVPEGLNVAIVQSEIFGEKWGTLGTKAFLVMAFLMLFSVMWAIISAFTRIVSDILFVNSKSGPWMHKLSFLKRYSLPRIYFFLIVFLVAIQAALVPFKQPLTYIVVTSVLGGIVMSFYIPLLIFINNRRLPKAIRPNWLTNLGLFFAALFYGVLSLGVIITLFKR